MNNTNDFNLKKVLPAVLTIAIGMLLVMMDTTIMNVTLPHIQSAFHQNLSNSQWVITAYTLAMATVIPFAGFFINVPGIDSGSCSQNSKATPLSDRLANICNFPPKEIC